MNAPWHVEWSKDTASAAPLDHPFEVFSVGTIPFQVADLNRATNWLQAAAKDKFAISIRLANAYCVALADTDAEYSRLLRSSGINFPDGTPVVWFMKRRRTTSPSKGVAGRVRGPSFFDMSLSKGQFSGTKNFFLGATAETLEKLVEHTKISHPSSIVCGTYSPPFAPVTPEFLEDCARHVILSEADVVWVGLGTPKQDVVTTQLSIMTGRPCVGVGAAFDFAARQVREAPKWVQDSGFEWAFRLASEPRRLWRRYFFGNLRFLKAALFPPQGNGNNAG